MIPLGGSSHGLCQPEHALWGLELRQNNNNNATDEAADADMSAPPNIWADNSYTHAGAAVERTPSESR